MATDFCGALRISTGVTLIESGGSWSININLNGQHKDLAQSLATHNCEYRSAGVKLAQVTMAALNKAVANHKADELRKKSGRQMPLILMKDFLFKTAGACTTCKGRGCSACNNMGVV